MEKLGTFSKTHKKVLSDAQNALGALQKLSSRQCKTVEEAIGILDQLRKETYEDLNQIQHEHMIIQAAEWLIAKRGCSPQTQWLWNPRQTGDASEPDLRGVCSGAVKVSAEITTSEKPAGTIDSRMRKTLDKLAKMEGDKFYFVRTPKMHQRAETKIKKAGWEIEVVLLAV